MDPHAVLSGLEPAPFWRHFSALTQIPRPPGGEERVAAHVLAWADAHRFAHARDAAGNLVVRVPATPGRERAPAVILQGHLDMVCERDPDSPYDPRTGPVAVLRDGDWLRADGTTLGADDGVAIAAMMTVGEGDAPHGPLELLMTVQEEVGLVGARALDPELIGGTLLLNLDSEEDATLTVGCAGSVDTIVRFTAARTPIAEPLLRVTATGARGGHSGGDIALGRANAIKALARALRAAPGLRIAALNGGASRNAIPREATALVIADAVPIEAEATRIADAFRSTDPGVRIEVAPMATAASPGAAWSAADSARIVDLLTAIPSGPLAMSVAFPGVVETSSSLGIAGTERDTLALQSLSRSANDAALPDVTNAIAAAARLAGAQYEQGDGYPGWRPDLTSPLLAQATATHERLFGAAPHVTLTHGGLEAAIIAAKRPGIDALSFGPQIEGPHAPGERLNIPSAGRFMRLLSALLDAVSR